MITQFAIRNNVVTFTVLVLLLFSGISFFNDLPRDDMPSFLIRNVSIVTSYQGGSPERIENLITDKIEKVIQEIAEVDYIKSESRTGVSIINVAIKESEFVLQPIFDRIRRKVDDVKDQLPEGSQVTFKDELGDVFGVIIGLTADGYSYSEMKDVADEIRDDLIKLPNVAKVELSGIQDERVYIEFEPSKLAEIGLTQRKLQDIISATNIIVPGGSINIEDRITIIEPSGSFESIADLENIILLHSGNAILRLRDVAQIRRGYIEPQKSIISINGQPGLAIAVNLIKGGNIISMGEDIDKKIASYLKIYPYGINISRVASQDVVVDKSVNNFITNLIQAVAVVMLVMLAFLGFRTGLVVASLIPVSMVAAIVLMSLFVVGLNKVALAALIIALGMLVDNAIVMTESIMVKMEKGLDVLESVISSSKELIIPLLTSSLTTSAAFMAFFLAESVLGEIMGNIFIVLTFTLISSWLLSVTMISLLCLYFIKVKKVEKTEKNNTDIFSRLAIYYKIILVYSLRNPAIIIASIAAMFIGTLYLAQFLPTIFMAKSDRPLVTVNIELPLGTAIERTKAVVTDIEKMVESQLYIKSSNSGETQGVVNWSSYVGVGAPKYDLGYSAPESSPHTAHLLLNTSSDAANDDVIAQVDQYIFNNFLDVKYKVSRLISGGGSADPIVIRISGKDINELFRLSVQVKSDLRSVPGSKNISDDWGMLSKKFVANIDLSKAQLAGISNQDIATSLQTQLGGKQSGSFREGDNVIPIIMQDISTNNLSVDDLETLNIYSQQSGKNTPLSQVAELQVVWDTTKIIRRDLTRTISITADVKTGFTAAGVVSQLKPKLFDAKKSWPDGYDYAYGGDAEGSSSAMGAVIDKMPISLFVIVLLLVAQFNSIRKPIIILATIPLGLIGVIPGLLVTGSYIGFMAFLGIISLAGIVINNGIVLLDRIDIELNENNRSPYTAIVEAALQRFRPILLTTATTSFGLIPLWLGGGLLWEPMAISIIFGLLFATVLTLIFVPVMYKLLFRVPNAS